MAEILGRIVSPYFVAGVVIKNDRVIDAAPIVRYMIGWDRDRVRKYVKSKNWTIRKIS